MNSTSKVLDILSQNLDKVREQIDPGLFISAILVALAAAFVASFLYRFFYERRGTGSQVHRAFPLLAVAITTLFIGVQISIPLSLGLLGSLSIIRFRTPIKEPEEVGFIMLVIAASISAATFNFAFIFYMYIAAILSLIIMRGGTALRWFKRDGLLIITMPTNLALKNYKALEDYLSSKTKKLTLESTATHAGQTTYQFVISGITEDVASLELGIGNLIGEADQITGLNIFLDRPGGIR